MITVVGSVKSTFPFMDSNKNPFYHEDDPNNFYYGEMCGHKFMLDSWVSMKKKIFRTQIITMV